MRITETSPLQRLGATLDAAVQSDPELQGMPGEARAQCMLGATYAYWSRFAANPHASEHSRRQAFAAWVVQVVRD